MPKLALLGGRSIRRRAFPSYRTIGTQEGKAVLKILESGLLSEFLGCCGESFYGGPTVKDLEKRWASYFGVKHAISVNSATSGLYCATGAAGVGPGDEVIVSPYTMTASAVAPLVYNAIPIFADIEEDYFCLDPESVESRITTRTKAIIVVDIFGQPYDAARINIIAKKHGLTVIEDAAQAAGATYKNRLAGTLADIGVYSLNYHKHIHTGEGGVVVTNDDILADKIRLIRNHAEAVIDGRGFNDPSSLINMIGFNYRMTEIEAAIGIQQLKKLSALVKTRQENVAYLTKRLSMIPCIRPAKIRPDCTHAFYLQPLLFDRKAAGLRRDIFIKAVNAELFSSVTGMIQSAKINCGYVKPLYLQPIFQKKIAYGRRGCPWNCRDYGMNVNYRKGACPVSEKMHEDELILHELMKPGVTKKDLDDVVYAFEKVYENRRELQSEYMRRDK